MIVEALVILFIGGALLNIWASWRVLTDHLSSWQQRIAQLAFVWLLPFIGALVTLHLKKNQPEQVTGTYREIPDAGDDFGYSGKATRHTRANDLEAPSHDEPPSHD
jgi:TRAP-type C4-dicarboxylate transport system permease small subunit